MNNKRPVISSRTFDEERALYNLTATDVVDCTFAGPADGESVLKEARDVSVSDCSFSLRYPFWHAEGVRITNCAFDELARAAIWYAKDGAVENCTMGGIKALRECSDFTLHGCKIASPEFGWKCDGIRMDDCSIESEYLFFYTSNVALNNVKMSGKYSFQYMDNVELDGCQLDTKDAFWHSTNVTVRSSKVKGEYLGWFSDGLTLIDCQIEGTQPLCYCKNLRLVNCTMKGCDLSFEYSEVEADIRGHIDSVKNPKSGRIVADSVGEVIWEDSVMECSCEISTANKPACEERHPLKAVHSGDAVLVAR